ncbi:transposase, MuDR, MULE transposase domain protein [Tanacetum coccineum]
MDRNNQIIPIATGVSQGETDAQDDELTPWATAKIRYRMLKSSNWTVKGVDKYKIYEVRDNKMIRVVYLEKGECACHRWELSGLPCGHVCVVARFKDLSNVNNLAKPWFLNRTIKDTYEGIIYPIKDVSTWQTPHDLQLVLPPVMGNKLPGKPKNEDQIRSQIEGPIITKCGRCSAMGHNRSACNVPLPSFQEKNNFAQQESSNPSNSFRKEPHEEANHDIYQQRMYNPQHLSNNMEDMYHL